MKVTLKSIKILNKKQPPYFSLSTQEVEFDKSTPIVKVLAFSVDPVMKVWLAGAKTNFRVVGAGDTFNCFGVGLVIHSRDEMYP
jgi:NADPH-dependent curcumin reductase CurA